MRRKQLTDSDFLPFNLFEKHYPIIVDLVYANPDHPDNHFKNLYHREAKLLWAHNDIIAPVLLASEICRWYFSWTLKLNDCLRPVEGQESMLMHGYHPSLVSPPGTGPHPRGMAIDVEAIGHDLALGKIACVDMGARFDEFPEDPKDLSKNRAARHYRDFGELSDEIVGKREFLERAMVYAAECCDQSIIGYPDECWDFRFLAIPEKGVRKKTVTYWDDYEAVREENLPSHMHLVNRPTRPSELTLLEWQIAAGDIHRKVQTAWRAVLATKQTVRIAPFV